MRTIIQLSDFHIKVSMGEPEYNKVFTGLVSALKGMELHNSILLYNGDVIDSKVIGETIDPSLPDAEKACLWDSGAEEAYALAKKYFDYFTTNLDIANDHIIICCGNHDVNSYYATGTESLVCPGSKGEVSYDPKRFKQFAKFCDSIQSRRNTSGTYFRVIDNINFLVVNTNWINKWTPTGRCDLCIACEEIRQHISEKKDKLERTKRERSKLHNILVAHAPYTNYCEEALFAFKENEYSAITDHIDYLFGLKLYGDKHTDKINNFDYIVGAPLDADRITCGIHQFDDAFCHHYKSLVYADGEWKVVGSESDIAEILDISRDSIKTQTLQYLYGTKSTADLEKKIVNFELIRSSDQWNELDRLIRNYADIQKPQKVGAGKPIIPSDGFINTLTGLISDSSSKVSITMRGEERLGKSVCMSLLYMNLLHKFICGTFEYMPVYINIENIIAGIRKKNRDSKEFLIALQSIIGKKLKVGIKLAKRLQRPACCLIDGINKFYLYENARIEDMVATELEGMYGKQYMRFVYCIDTGGNPKLGSTPQDVKKDAEYIVYFNRLLTKQVTSQKKYPAFVKGFCTLQDKRSAGKTAKIVLENIERMQIREVDTNLFVNFWENLSVENEKTFFGMVSELAMRKIGRAQLAVAGEVCFQYHYKGKSYTEIKKTHNISDSVFELIRTQKELARFLLAANYIHQIQNTGQEITPDSCLNVLYNHEICTFIREYIYTYNLQDRVVTFAREAYEKLSFEGKATITYLLGRIAGDRPDILPILNEHEVCLRNLSPETENVFTKSIAQRSVRLSKMFAGGNPRSQVNSYIRTLISDEHERSINRVFYLQFYGDSPTDGKDIIKEGFDIYNTYNILASRLNKWKNTNVRYTLLELELFTLCDLLQLRIDTPYAITNSGGEVASFFYHPKFNQPKDDMAMNILSFMIEVIEKYIEHYSYVEENPLFLKYLVMQNKQYKEIIDKLVAGPLVAERDEYIPGKLLDQLVELEKVKRIGWDIPNVIEGMICEEDFRKLQKEGNVLETTLHHTYEAYLIGLLYLPKTSRTESSYQKQQILNMILVHDFGESLVGDIVPAYEHYYRSRESEKEFCENLFLQGVHSGVADLSEYFTLWEQWCASTEITYNIRIAKEIDTIQMLYKLMILLSEKRVDLKPARVSDFWSTRNSINTPEGKAIFNKLIARNHSFQNTAYEYELTLTELL